MSDAPTSGARAIRAIFTALGLAGIAVAVWLGLSEAFYLRVVSAQLAYGFLIAAAVLLAVVCEIAALVKGVRGHRSALYPWLVVALVAPFLGSRAGRASQAHALARVQDHGRDIVGAIYKYYSAKQHFPAKLSELVPAYIAELPTPELRGHPQFDYVFDDGRARSLDEAPCHPWQTGATAHGPMFWLYVARPDMECEQAFGYSGETGRWGNF